MNTCTKCKPERNDTVPRTKFFNLLCFRSMTIMLTLKYEEWEEEYYTGGESENGGNCIHHDPS